MPEKSNCGKLVIEIGEIGQIFVIMSKQDFFLLKGVVSIFIKNIENIWIQNFIILVEFIEKGEIYTYFQ